MALNFDTPHFTPNDAARQLRFLPRVQPGLCHDAVLKIDRAGLCAAPWTGPIKPIRFHPPLCGPPHGWLSGNLEIIPGPDSTNAGTGGGAATSAGFELVIDSTEPG